MLIKEAYFSGTSIQPYRQQRLLTIPVCNVQKAILCIFLGIKICDRWLCGRRKWSVGSAVGKGTDTMLGKFILCLARFFPGPHHCFGHHHAGILTMGNATLSRSVGGPWTVFIPLFSSNIFGLLSGYHGEVLCVTLR